MRQLMPQLLHPLMSPLKPPHSMQAFRGQAAGKFIRFHDLFEAIYVAIAQPLQNSINDNRYLGKPGLSGEKCCNRDFIRGIENDRCRALCFRDCPADVEAGETAGIRWQKIEPSEGSQIQLTDSGTDAFRPGQAESDGSAHVRITHLCQY